MAVTKASIETVTRRRAVRSEKVRDSVVTSWPHPVNCTVQTNFYEATLQRLQDVLNVPGGKNVQKTASVEQEEQPRLISVAHQ
jgi:hypothetical protein